jgi:acyl-CoA synthetase (AMP-forming)/AMP-acid ligase II
MPRGYVQLTDRTKDVIKSGGEWISSVDLEDELLKHDSVAEIAVIAIEDPRWQERPLGDCRRQAGHRYRRSAGTPTCIFARQSGEVLDTGILGVS